MISLKGRIPQLNGLRAVAIGLVLVTHLWAYPSGHLILNRLAAAGWLGVQLSFVLSGFLITKVLIASKTDPHYYRNFYARRHLRTLPLYFALLATVFFVLPAFIEIPAALHESGWMYWLYLSNFALAAGGWQLFLTDITWSLAVEEQFYLVWPRAIKNLTRSRMIKFCLALVMLAPFARALLWSEDNWRWAHMMMPLRADAFAIGALLYLLPLASTRRVAAPVFALGAGVLAALVLTGNFSRTSMLAGTIGYSLVAIVSAAGLILAIESKTLASKALVKVGSISFGLYLLHPLCLAVTSSLLGLLELNLPPLANSIVQLSATTGMSIGVAMVSFRLFESPILKLRKYFPSAGLPAGTKPA
jgi:peptidoglycan/LPS O-acetylase OafA/YrhL